MGNTVSSRALDDAHLDNAPGQLGTSDPAAADLGATVRTGADPDRRTANHKRRLSDRGAANDGRRTSDIRAKAGPMAQVTGSTVIWVGLVAVMTAVNLAVAFGLHVGSAVLGSAGARLPTRPVP